MMRTHGKLPGFLSGKSGSKESRRAGYDRVGDSVFRASACPPRNERHRTLPSRHWWRGWRRRFADDWNVG
jgi:hypothetical protein